MQVMIKLKDLLKEAQTGHIVDHHPAMAFTPQKEESVNEGGMELKKLEDAIKMFQKKIEKQGRVTNARDEDHLKNLIKIYKQMGGKKIKESVNEMHVDNKINDRGYAELKKESKHFQAWARSFGKAIKYKNDWDVYMFVQYIEAKAKDLRGVLDDKKNIKKKGEA